MRLLKDNVLLRLYNSYLVDSPQPTNISYFWNFGSLLALCLVLQILTGCFLAMHYVANVDLAFDSVEHIMRDVSNGYLVRYVHANVASFFFIFVYAHIARNIFYGSFKTPRVLVWNIGVIILVLLMAIAFLGYKKQYSPKWFNLNKKEKIIIYNNINNKNNPINKNLIINKRGYCTSCVLNKFNNNKSNRLKIILEELNLNPVYIYEDLNLDETRKQILNDTKNLSGIYMIINKITKDYYIGSASTNRFYARYCNHIIYFRGSKIVKLAIKKYELKNFAFIILELYPNIVTKENNKELLDLEDKYLKLLLPNYNILTEAGSSFGYKHTEIDRLKMKDIYTEARREIIGYLNKGKKLSSQTIEKIRENILNRSPMSNETKQKCIVNTRPVILYNINGTIFGKYPTIKEASNAINCNEKTIRKALKTTKNLVKGQWIVKDLLDK
jgi:group I intron endonuclease